LGRALNNKNIINKNMSNRSIVIIIIVVILIALGILWLAPFSNPSEEQNDNANEENAPEVVRANHFFKDGTHTLEGTITLPTPCYTLETNVDVSAEAITSVINFVATAGSGVCTQVIAEKIFSVSFEADENTDITARYNGKPIRFDIIEGTEGGIEKL